MYKCVCKQYSEQLYADLMTHIRTRLASWTTQLAEVTDQQFISEFHKVRHARLYCILTHCRGRLWCNTSTRLAGSSRSSRI